MPNAEPPPNIGEVIKTEEKGSDVNFSVHPLNDAWKDRYDCAVLVTNDSDMTEAIRLVKEEFRNKRLGLITPKGRPTNGLKRYANFSKTIGEGDLAAAQFLTMIKRSGASYIFKPPSW